MACRPLRDAELQALTLSHGEGVRALVGAQRFALLVQDLALGHVDALGQPAAGVPVRDEADVVAVRLVGHGEATGSGLGANLGLGGGVRQRENAVLKLFVGQHAQHVGLVLGPVGGAVQFRVASVSR